MEHSEMDINNDDYLLSVLNGIENVLNEIKSIERKQIKITKKGFKNWFKNCDWNIGEIIKLLQSKINDFMFICNMKYINENCKMKLDKDDLENYLKHSSLNIKLRMAKNGKSFFYAMWILNFIDRHNL